MGRISNLFTFCMGFKFGLRLELTLALFENKAAGELMRVEAIGGERKGSGLQFRRTGVDRQAQQWDRENRGGQTGSAVGQG
jgi:hypothetical protein